MINLKNSLTPLIFNQQCMRGSCSSNKVVPQQLVQHIEVKGTPAAVLSADPYCQNHTLPPVNPPSSGAGGRPFGLLATVIALCAAVVGAVAAFMIYVAIESHSLSKAFKIHILQPPTGAQPAVKTSDAGLPLMDSASLASLLSHDNNGECVGAVGVAFSEVTYQVDDTHKIFGPVTGLVTPGQMVGVLGPSGAGKSSLLDILAGRPKVGHVGGNVSVFSTNQPTSTLHANVAYVLQDDVLVTTDTVAETLLFTARLKSPGKSQEEAQRRVEQVLQSLKLTHIANSRIGDGVSGGGISGGERKRVSIGVELVSTPSLLVLDEPTSGLDSTSTLVVLDVLRQVADEGCSVVFSIHQPSLKAFVKFDQILLMSKTAGPEHGGQQLFMGTPQETIRFFRELAFTDQQGFIPQELADQLQGARTPMTTGNTYDNPAESLLDVACIEGSRNILGLAEAFWADKVFKQLQEECQAALEGSSARPVSNCKPAQAASGAIAFWLLLKRSTRHILRNPLLLIGHLVVTTIIAGAIALFGGDMPLDFLGVQTRVFLFNFLVLYFSMVATSSMGAVIQERSVFIRERAARFYPSWCYCCSKLICDLVPLRSFPPMLLAYIIYWPFGLRDSDVAFTKFLIALLFANYAAASICLFISAVCKDLGQANLFAAAYTIYAFIFSGMLLTGGNQAAMDIRYTSIFFYPWEVSHQHTISQK
jgi:ABC-type multidrug transport system ATPase subunit